MSYDPVDIHKVIQDDLKKMEGKLTPVKVSGFTRSFTHYASPYGWLHDAERPPPLGRSHHRRDQ